MEAWLFGSLLAEINTRCPVGERQGVPVKIKRIMIAAPKSGSGKTMVTCALLTTLKERGCQVASYKCGPDYIDPMFHEKIIHVPSKNLDTFFTGEEKTRELFLEGVENMDFAVLEGVMGLYDGLGGIGEEGSSYHLAKVTKTPIILVVDAKGMGRSLLPLIAGFLSYDKEHLIQGVILNKISRGYYEIIKPLIEQELKITVAGFLPEKKECQIESRHLGLVMPGELTDIQEKLRTAAEEFSKTVPLETIIKIAEQAQELPTTVPGKNIGETIGCTETFSETAPAGNMQAARQNPRKAVIAVARDEAFCFYYADNFRTLEEYGAELVFFSPLRDEKLPKGCHALLLGGGYPELYAESLSRNHGIQAAIRQAARQDMPLVAECGGFMYLHSAITDKEGICHPMAGVLPGTCSYTGKLVRFGYVELLEKQSHFLPEGQRIRGHEFHYYDSTENGEDITAVKPASKKEYSCIISNEHQWMGFPHLYYPSNPAFARSFVEKAEAYKKRMGEQ